jgi:hypothetical protein
MPQDLATSIAAHRVVLFLGAALSAMLGLPPWAELIAHLKCELGQAEAQEPAPPSASNDLILAEHDRNGKGSLAPLRDWMAERRRLKSRRAGAFRISHHPSFRRTPEPIPPPA